MRKFSIISDEKKENSLIPGDAVDRQKLGF